MLNHAGAFKKTELTPRDFENAVEMTPETVLQHDPNLFGAASNNGQMLGEVNRRHKLSEQVRQLALKLGGRQPVEQKKKGVLGMLSKSGKVKSKAS